jgi:signal transduction histidine kinase
VLGKPVDLLFTRDDLLHGVPEQEAWNADRYGRAADERWHVRKDGTQFFASGVLTPLGLAGSVGYVKVLRDLTDRKSMEDALREARDNLEIRVEDRTAQLARANDELQGSLDARNELLRRVVTAQEDERRRVARELHDGLGQELTGLLLGLKALEQAIPKESPGWEQLQSVRATVDRISRESHDLAIALRPTALDDFGLESALSTYVAVWRVRTGIAVEFQAAGLGSQRLPSDVETAIYRIVQEALNNVAKHAAAQRVSVIVTRQSDDVTALVEDDGRGFQPGAQSRASNGPRLGLLSMRERVGLAGGTLTIESGPGQGTTIRVTIPLAASSSNGQTGL